MSLVGPLCVMGIELVGGGRGAAIAVLNIAISFVSYNFICQLQFHFVTNLLDGVY